VIPASNWKRTKVLKTMGNRTKKPNDEPIKKNEEPNNIIHLTAFLS